MPSPLVLCYHAISPTWDADLSTTPERFEQQLELLSRRGYRGTTFTEALTTPMRGRVVAITFDDAYRSVLERARPLLDRFEMPATVFVPTDHVDGATPVRWPGVERWIGGPHEHELLPMTWEQLRGLASAGWEIGSHTGSHPHLTRVDDTVLANELARSKAACERALERPCTSLAYPYGDVDARVIAATRAAGYRVAAALPARTSSRDVLEWPRIGVYYADDDRRFRLKVSPLVRRVRSSGAWGLLDGARRQIAAVRGT